MSWETDARAELRNTQRKVRRMGLKRRLLGYGIFSGVYWGSYTKFWQFERLVGIQPSVKEAWEAARSISHCLSKDVRRIYNTTVLNTGHHTGPTWQRATRNLKA